MLICKSKYSKKPWIVDHQRIPSLEAEVNYKQAIDYASYTVHRDSVLLLW
jgi:hypothetical protein